MRDKLYRNIVILLFIIDIDCVPPDNLANTNLVGLPIEAPMNITESSTSKFIRTIRDF